MPLPLRGARAASLSLVLAVTAAALAPPARAQVRAAVVDPAQRGLDLLLAGPTVASTGAKLTFAMQIVGYRTVLDAAPLAGATVEASWDPTLGADVPPPRVATADAAGRAAVEVTMPRLRADASSARLFVTVKHGKHRRTREVEVSARPAREVELIVPDQEVIPGAKVGAWVRVVDRVDGRRLAGLPVVVEMLDGGVPRDRVRGTTDATGSVLASLRAPPLPEGGGVAWSLRASLADESASSALRLVPREEVPAQPDLSVAWDAKVVDAGAPATARLRLRDASGDPIAGAQVEWLVVLPTPDGDHPVDWERAKKVSLDHDGAFAVAWPAPTAFAGEGITAKLFVRWNTSERELERNASVVVRKRGGASFTVMPEAGVVIPGVRQRVLVRATGDDGAPITGNARVFADGLDAAVVLDAAGEAELDWAPPRDVGSRRDVGPCARSVAATVGLEEPSGRLTRRGGRAFACVGVDRGREGALQVDPPLARAGSRVKVHVLTPDPKDGRGTFAIQLTPANREQGVSRTVWVEIGEDGAEVEMPPGPRGVWSLAAFKPREGRKALIAEGSVLLAPAVLPSVQARIVGGRIAPSGEIEVEAKLTDEAGRPIEGLVAGLVYDAFGGSSAREIARLDTRVALCEDAGVAVERCPTMWGGSPAGAALARGSLGDLPVGLRGRPLTDPGGSAREELEAAFKATLKSLEGAVYEASSAPDRLIDARRDGARGRSFNPELFRIVTEALPTPPETPGGEPLELADLVAVDPQVTFDVVARRVTRLKVFRLATQVRKHRHEENLDLAEPALRDPNSFLARLTSSGEIEPAALLDPWGGTMRFRKARGGDGSLPIAAIPGWELASPGPDGREGSGDDVVDPFARILKTGSPYARALGEDAIVLARHDARLFDATVDGWSTLLEENTGTALGNASGSGQGRLGGSHRSKAPSVRMGATMVNRRGFEPAWSVPTRTKGGVARLRLPLGSVDTTYRVLLVGLADGGDPAVTQLDVPIATPIAARIDAGDRWTVGDEVEVAVRVRNRTDRESALVATITAGGAASLAPREPARRSVRVPARGTSTIHARVAARRDGEGSVEVVLRDAAGATVDAVRTTVPIVAPGRRTVVSRARWVAGEVEIPGILPGEGERALGPPRLIVDGGIPDALFAALGGLEPDRLGTPDALVDAIEASARIELFAKESAKGADLAARARGVRDRGRGRLASWKLDPRTAEIRRALAFVELPDVAEPAAPCGDGEAPGSEETKEGTRAASRDAAGLVARALALAEAEPSAASGTTSSCWESVASNLMEDVVSRGDPVETARLVLAFAERPHRVADAKLLALRLAKALALEPSGRLSLPAALVSRRDARTVVYAALLRASVAGAQLPASRDALLGWLLVQRDGAGAFGSSLATRAAVTALLAQPSGGSGSKPIAATSLVIESLDDDDDRLGAPVTHRVEEGSRAARFPIAPGASLVRVTATGVGALVRLERDMLLPGLPSAELFGSPLRLDVTWPPRPRVGVPGVLEVRLRTTRARDTRARVHLPLPPGVSLAEAVDGVRAVEGALLLEMSGSADDLPVPKRIPVRFALAGSLTAPEASATLAEEASAPTFVRVPKLEVSPAPR